MNAIKKSDPSKMTVDYEGQKVEVDKEQLIIVIRENEGLVGIKAKHIEFGDRVYQIERAEVKI